jgi:hypothetical protein
MTRVNSKRALRRRSCDGKVRYTEFGAARWAMHRMLRHEGSDGARMNVYRCRFCRGFHFGHAPRPRTSRGASVLATTAR